jgi:hypothetical protein
VRCSALAVLTTKIRQTILRSISGIMVMVVVAAADLMDRDTAAFMGRDKAEYSISRVLSDRNPGCRDSNNYAFE